MKNRYEQIRFKKLKVGQKIIEGREIVYKIPLKKALQDTHNDTARYTLK